MTPQAYRQMIDAATPGPCVWTQSLPMSIDEQAAYMAKHLSHGQTGVMNGIGLPRHPRTVLGDNPLAPTHMVEMATCGNGPNGENNARMLAASVNLAPLLADLWEAADDVGTSGIESDIPGIDYVTVQIDRKAWATLQNALDAMEAAT